MIVYIITVYLIIGVVSAIYWLGHDNHVEKYIYYRCIILHYFMANWHMGKN